jgi:hypothetical protein
MTRDGFSIGIELGKDGGESGPFLTLGWFGWRWRIAPSPVLGRMMAACRMQMRVSVFLYDVTILAHYAADVLCCRILARMVFSALISRVFLVW